MIHSFLSEIDKYLAPYLNFSPRAGLTLENLRVFTNALSSTGSSEQSVIRSSAQSRVQIRMGSFVVYLSSKSMEARVMEVVMNVDVFVDDAEVVVIPDDSETETFRR
jgi:hypothetical protein